MSIPPREDIVGVAKTVIGQAGRYPGEFEVYVEHSETTSVKVYRGDVESLVTGVPRGLGVRYIDGARSGYAYTGDFSPGALEQVVSMAVANTTVSDPDEAVGLPDAGAGYVDIPGLWRPALTRTSLEHKIGLALTAEQVALASSEIETVEESSYVDFASRYYICSTRGVDAYAEHTFCYVYLSAHARRGADVQTALGFDTGREPAELDAEAAGREAAEKATALLGSEPCPTGRYTVVLDREVAAAVIGTVAQALSADAVQKGRSLFANRVGTRVAAESLQLVDDGLHPDGMETASFDDEGVPRRTTPLIEKGVLQGFMYDTYTASRQGKGTRSTGNARRSGYRSSPGVAPTNLVVGAGEGTLEDLIRRVGSGVYVTGISGLHSGANPVTGEFSVGAVGHMIEGGAVARGVREITIASDLISLLTNISDSAGDTRWIPFHGSVYTPSLAMLDISVGGS
jgi:PmbA protein